MLWRSSLLRASPTAWTRRTVASAASPLTVAKAKFMDAVNSSNRHAILTSYRLLRSILVTSQSSSSSHFPDDEILLRAMAIMARSNVKNETNMAFIIYADLTSIFSKPVTPNHQSVYVQALLSRGWLEQARLRLADYPAHTSDYNVVMHEFLAAKKYESALEIFQDVVKRHLDPDDTTYRMTLECLSNISNQETVKAVTRAMDGYLSTPSARSHFTKFFWPTLLSMFARRSAPEFPPQPEGSGDSSRGKPEQVSDKANGGPSSDGGSASSVRAEKILQEATKASDLRRYQQSSNTTPGSSQWAIVIGNAAQQKGLSSAAEVYAAAKEAGVAPTFEMILPLVQHTLDRRIRSSEDQHLNDALQLYREAFSEESSSKESCPTAIVRVFELLLRTLADTNTPSTSFPITLSLIRDMITLDTTFPAHLAEKMLVMLIRASPSHDTAFEVYSFFKEQHASELESSLDDSALMAFLQLSFPEQPFPPVSLFFLLLSDMQRRGYAWSKRAYTLILARIARVLKDDKSLAPSGLSSIQHIHKRLLLDTNLSPDTALLNALMNAYNYAEAASEALKVWELLFIQGKHDNASLSIVLDTLSHAGAIAEGAALVSKIKKTGFPLDRNNWQSWLELLCRADKIEQASRLLCFDMKRSDPPITPDIDHIETLLKYAWNVGKRGEIQAKIKKYLPAIWSGLPDRLRD